MVAESQIRHLSEALLWTIAGVRGRNALAGCRGYAWDAYTLDLHQFTAWWWNRQHNGSRSDASVPTGFAVDRRLASWPDELSRMIRLCPAVTS